MLAGSLLLGFSVMLVAVWLEYHDSILFVRLAKHSSSVDPVGGDASRFTEDRYRRVRRRWRMVIHGLLAICGGLMIGAGFAGLGAFWIAAWTAIAMLMLCIVGLAFCDAVRTHHHHSRILKESRDETRAEAVRQLARRDHE